MEVKGRREDSGQLYKQKEEDESRGQVPRLTQLSAWVKEPVPVSFLRKRRSDGRRYCFSSHSRIAFKNALPYRAALYSPTPETSRNSSIFSGRFTAMSARVALEKTT